MLLTLAWRNIWRNHRRTILTVSALTAGIAAIVFLDSYRESTFKQMIGVVTTGLVGNLQVHGAGYQDNPDISTVIPNPAQTMAKLQKALPGAHLEERVVGYGLGGSARDSDAVMILGIDPAQQDARSRLFKVVAGMGLGSAPAHRAVVGAGLASRLGLRPGSELVLLGEAADRSMANDRYMVSGIAKTGSGDLDDSAVFLQLKDAQSFFALGGAIHEILVRLEDPGAASAGPLAAARAALDSKSLEVLSWSQMLPELKGMIQQKRNGQYGMDFVVFLIVALGVLNTMSMSTFERTREFGVMASLGTRRRRILGLVVTESLLQGLIGLVIGVALAAAVLHAVGSIDFGSMAGQDIGGVRIPSTVTLSLQARAIGDAFSTAFFIALVGALWPAYKASRLAPAEATRVV